MTKEEENHQRIAARMSSVKTPPDIEAAINKNFFDLVGSPTPPTPAGAGTETPSREFSSNPHDHGMVPDTFSPPGFTSWRLRTNEEWVALTEALRHQAEADRATIAGLIKAEDCALELMDTVARGFDRCLGRILAGDPTGAERELRLAIARVDSPLKHDGKSIAQLRAQLASADKDRERLEWLMDYITNNGIEGLEKLAWTLYDEDGKSLMGREKVTEDEVDECRFDRATIDDGIAALQPSPSLDHGANK